MKEFWKSIKISSVIHISWLPHFLMKHSVVAGYATKVVEKVFEYRIRQQVEKDDMQFDVMNGTATTDAA